MFAYLMQVIYGVVGVVLFSLTIAALKKDSWTESSSTTVGHMLPCDKSISLGNAITGGCSVDWGFFWELNFSQKVVAIALILAIVLEALCLIFNVLTALSCCCKDKLKKVLIFLTLFVVILLLIVVAAAAHANNKNIEELDKAFAGTGVGLKYGSSFIMAVISLILAIANLVVACAAKCCAKNLAGG